MAGNVWLFTQDIKSDALELYSEQFGLTIERQFKVD
jgi:hypothetical protein